jgi:hypothetical protein
MMFSPMSLAAVEPQFPLPTMHTVLLFSVDKSGFFVDFAVVDFAVADFFVVTFATFAMVFLVVAVFVMSASASR